MTTDPPPFVSLPSFGGRIPIVVGVTGHRDVVEAPSQPGLAAPRAEIERVLRSLLAEFPSTPLLVLTALAEGADTLAAEVALSLADDPLYRLPGGGSRIALAVVLPMPLSSLARDFQSPVHVQRVRGLLSEAAVSYVLPGETDGSPAGPARRAAYRGLAAHLVRHSHVLLALWDGRSGRAGGTADVVRSFCEGGTGMVAAAGPAPDPLRAPLGGRLIHVPVERLGGPGAGPPAPSANLSEPPRTFQALEEFNRDVASGGPSVVAAVARAAERSDLSAEGASGAWRPAPGPLAAYAATYAAADALASKHRGRRGRAFELLAATGFAAVACFEVYAHVPGAPRLLLGAYLLAFAASFAVVAWARRARVEEKHLVYRSLAEALRVQVAWRAVGSSDSAADHYEPLQENEIAWVRRALRGLDVLSRGGAEAASPVADPRGLAWARDQWIKPQVAFYERRIEHVGRAARRCRLGFRLAACAGLALAAGLFVVETFSAGAGDASPVSHVTHGLALVGMVALLAIAALFQARSREHAYEALARRYASALQMFLRAQIEVESGLATGDPGGRLRALEALRSLGRAALAENVGWLLLFRDHELHVDP